MIFRSLASIQNDTRAENRGLAHLQPPRRARIAFAARAHARFPLRFIDCSFGHGGLQAGIQTSV
jgi:hypothetical protein